MREKIDMRSQSWPFSVSAKAQHCPCAGKQVQSKEVHTKGNGRFGFTGKNMLFFCSPGNFNGISELENVHKLISVQLHFGC